MAGAQQQHPDRPQHPDMIEMRGELNLLNQRLESSIQALNAGVSALGAEVHVIRGLQESGHALLMEKMQEVGSTSLHLRLLTESIREHNALEKSRQETTEAKLQDLRDKEATARGERRGAAFVLTLMVALVGYIYVADQGRQDKKNDALEALIAQRTAELQQQVNTNRVVLQDHATQLQAVQKRLGQ